MLSYIQSVGSCLIVLTLLLFAGNAAARDVSPGCAAAMDRAAAHYSRCLLRADAHYARHENATKQEKRQARCETRFERRTSRAIYRHGPYHCTSRLLMTALAARTVSYVEGVAIEAAGSEGASVLYVQDAAAGTLTETTLVLSGIDKFTGWFTERPYKEAGQVTTAEFVALFSEEGADSFAEDPPNAAFSCESDGEVVNQVVTLAAPVLDEAADTLTYTVVLVPTSGDDDSFAGITCDSDAHLFIDDQCEPGSYCEYQQYVPHLDCHHPIPTWGLSRTDTLPNEAPFSKDYSCFVAGYCKQAAEAGVPPQGSLQFISGWQGYELPWYNRYKDDDPCEWGEFGSNYAAAQAGCHEIVCKDNSNPDCCVPGELWKAGIAAFEATNHHSSEVIDMADCMPNGHHCDPYWGTYMAYQICQ